MPADEPQGPQTDRRRCPVCWTWFTPNSPSNPYPRRYCCGACRIEDSRRRRERKQTQLLLDELDVAPQDTPSRASHNHPEPPRLLDERTNPMNPH